MSGYRHQVSEARCRELRAQRLAELEAVPAPQWRALAARAARVAWGAALIVGLPPLVLLAGAPSPQLMLACVVAGSLVPGLVRVAAPRVVRARVRREIEQERGLEADQDRLESLRAAQRAWRAADRLEVPSRLLPLAGLGVAGLVALPGLLGALGWPELGYSIIWPDLSASLFDLETWVAPAIAAQLSFLLLAGHSARLERLRAGVIAPRPTLAMRQALLALAIALPFVVWAVGTAPDATALLARAIAYGDAWTYSLPLALMLTTGIPHVPLAAHGLARAAAAERAAFLEPGLDEVWGGGELLGARRARQLGGAAASIGMLVAAIEAAGGSDRVYAMVLGALVSGVGTGILGAPLLARVPARGELSRERFGSVAWPAAAGALLWPVLLGAPIGAELFDVSVSGAATLTLLGLAAPLAVLVAGSLWAVAARKQWIAWLSAVGAVWLSGIWVAFFWNVSADSVVMIALISMLPQPLWVWLLTRVVDAEQERLRRYRR